MFIVPFFAVKIDKGIQRIYNIGFDLKKQNRGWSSYHSVRLKLGHTRGQSSESKYAIGSYGSQGLKVFFCMF